MVDAEEERIWSGEGEAQGPSAEDCRAHEWLSQSKRNVEDENGAMRCDATRNVAIRCNVATTVCTGT